MRVHRIIADLGVPDLPGAEGFYRDYLGLGTEEFNLGWVARYTSPETGAHLQVGVHRFFVRAPDGNVLNVVGHPH